MPPRKKQKTLRDFTLVLSTISNLYEEQGDVGRSRSFSTASTNLCAFADVTNKELDAPLKSSEDFKDVKGVGKSTLEMLDEFIKTGTCSRVLFRVDELEEKQVALIREEEKSLELGVFMRMDGPEDSDDEDKEELESWLEHIEDENELYLYENGDEYQRALYKDAEDEFEDYINDYVLLEHQKSTAEGEMNFDEDKIRHKVIESFAGFQRLTEGHERKQMVFFVRKPNANDLKKQDWAGGDADINWKKPTGVTRDELRDLVLAGKTEDKHTEALEQLYKEEDAFLKEAEKDLSEALKIFPYEKTTFTLDEGLGLLRGLKPCDLGRCLKWGKYKMYVETLSHDHDEATVCIKCLDFDETLTCMRWETFTGMCEMNEDCFEFKQNEYLQSLNPEASDVEEQLEHLLHDIFEPFGLEDTPE
jgi:hypothetical protein